MKGESVQMGEGKKWQRGSKCQRKDSGEKFGDRRELKRTESEDNTVSLETKRLDL